MSELIKKTLTVKNYVLQGSSDLDALYSMVRCEDDEGDTVHFKQVVMLNYLKRHGAMNADAACTWYYKHLSKKSIILIAIEKANGKVEYDIDQMRRVAKSTIFKGFVYGVLTIPAGVIIATATYGFGLLFIPYGLYLSYRNIFKFPKMLRRQTLVHDLAAHGVVVR
ncbi:hypothetical protein [Pseudomonas fluorescens]|uniref:hypothetical protein n=1 Tax=Pseudomonas fluorescens TaxID=294 RepID=UPI000CCFFB7B|nr:MULTISPECIES: hypothetical protein [Pseudomonas]MDW8842243.1 hypothetical protein [Pseudomonas carnis]PNY72334.1 hypothetical protein C1751_23195 [Pseudomonas fluorescens]